MFIFKISTFRAKHVTLYRVLQNYLVWFNVLKLGQQFCLDEWDGLVLCRWHQAKVCWQQFEPWDSLGWCLCCQPVAESLVQVFHAVLIAFMIDAER